MATYRNPWHGRRPEYGPPSYTTNARPVEYRGHLIFQRVPDVCWDVVRDGVCVTQRAGPDGACRAIDERCDTPWDRSQGVR